jgi:hypothetical protein
MVKEEELFSLRRKELFPEPDSENIIVLLIKLVYLKDFYPNKLSLQYMLVSPLL